MASLACIDGQLHIRNSAYKDWKLCRKASRIQDMQSVQLPATLECLTDRLESGNRHLPLLLSARGSSKSGATLLCAASLVRGHL